jgi:hypothetical protein
MGPCQQIRPAGVRLDGFQRSYLNTGAFLMRTSHAIAFVVCALVFSAASLVAFRYQVVVSSSLIYRLDRWSGEIRVCIKQTPDDMHLLTCFQQGAATALAESK